MPLLEYFVFVFRYAFYERSSWRIFVVMCPWSAVRWAVNCPSFTGVLIISLARPGRKQAWTYVRDARDFNNIETQAVITIFFLLQGKAPKEIHAILTETLACFLPGRAKDLSALLY